MILRHSITYFLARSASGVFNLLTIALFTRLLSPVDYGRYALIVAAVGLLNNVLFGWLGQGVVRYLSAEGRESSQTTTAILGAWFVLNLGISAVAAGIAFTLAPPEWQQLVLLGVLMLWAQTWNDLCLEVHRSRLQPARYALMLMIRSGLALPIGVLAIQQGWGAQGALLGATGGLLFSGLLVKPAALQFHLQALRWSTVVELAQYGVPISVNAAFLMVVHFSDRFLIAAFLGEGAAGIYAAAYDLAQQSVALVLRSVGNAVPPLVFRAYEHGDFPAARQYLERNFQILSAVGGLMTTLLWGAAVPLSSVVVGAAFREEAARIIPIVALATFVVGLRTHHFMLPMLIQRQTRGVIIPSIAASIVNLGLNLWWIPNYGIQGAAWATLIAYSVALGMLIPVGRRLLPIPLQWRDVLKIGIGACGALLTLSLTASTRDWRGLLTEITVGACVYLTMLGILYPREVRDYLGALRRGTNAAENSGVD